MPTAALRTERDDIAGVFVKPQTQQSWEAHHALLSP
jgi:hypothetical protein